MFFDGIEVLNMFSIGNTGFFVSSMEHVAKRAFFQSIFGNTLTNNVRFELLAKVL